MSTPRIHEGILVLDQDGRYCVNPGPGQPTRPITLTSGTALEVLRNDTWITGHVEGDGQDYWLFVNAGGKLKLAEGLTVRYREPGYMPDSSQPVSVFGEAV